jgi:hypothetical protein
VGLGHQKKWNTSGSRGPTPKKEGLVAIFDNAVIPNLKNIAKIMAGFSKNPAILFAMFCRCSISDPAGIVMAP